MKSRPIAAAVVLLTACQPPAPLGPSPMGANLGSLLTPQQVRSEIVGNTGFGTRTGTHTKWAMYVNPDGTLSVTGAQPDETGSWKITDDGFYCMKLARRFDGQELCQRVYQTGSTIQFHSLYSLEEMTFQPGNKL